MSDPTVEEDPDGSIRVDFSGQSRAKAAMDKVRNKVLTEYSNIDLASGFPRDQIWVTQDKRRIAVPNMSDSHLQNTIQWLRKRAGQYKRQIAVRASLQYTMQLQMFDWDWPEDVAEDKANHYKEQLDNFMKQPDDDFLRDYCPQFKYMLQEAYKRKILIPAPVQHDPDVHNGLS